MTDVIARVIGLVAVADTIREMQADFPDIAEDLTHGVAYSMQRLAKDLDHQESTARAFDARLAEEDTRWRV